MTQFRRDDVKDMKPQSTTNAGLWLDKYLASDEDKAKKDLVSEVVGIKTQKAYRDFYAKWQEALRSYGALTKPAETQGRLAVNLGAEAVLENSIALNRTYGTPYIPGSALKGLAASYARNSLDDDWKKDTKFYNTLFGTQTDAGYVNFFDALFIPDSGKPDKDRGLAPDVVTVHHQDYYQGKKPEYLTGKDDDPPFAPPADWDSPIPIHFVTASGKFLLAISGPSKDWIETVYKILGLALEHEGVGAKTNSGYGRMKILENR